MKYNIFPNILCLLLKILERNVVCVCICSHYAFASIYSFSFYAAKQRNRFIRKYIVRQQKRYTGKTD
jgi:hypothetical protein